MSNERDRPSRTRDRPEATIAYPARTVLRYPYQWSYEPGTEGSKYRPAWLASRVRWREGIDLLVIYPMTSKPPVEGTPAMEVPETEKRAAGLLPGLRTWVLFTEYNRDVDRSWYIEPGAKMGMFSQPFHDRLMKEIVPLMVAGQATMVARNTP